MFIAWLDQKSWRVYFKKSKVAFGFYYSLYPTEHEVGQVVLGLHEDPLTWGYEIFFNLRLWDFFSETGFDVLKLFTKNSPDFRLETGQDCWLILNHSSSSEICFLEAVSAFWEQCEDELRPAERSTEPLNAFFFQYFKNICLQDVSTVIFLVNIAFMKDYVEVCEARKDHAPHTLSQGWNFEHNGTSWNIMEHHT